MGIVQAYVPELPRPFRFMIWFIKILFILGMLGTYLSLMEMGYSIFLSIFTATFYSIITFGVKTIYLRQK
jgi:hypothetical protein